MSEAKPQKKNDMRRVSQLEITTSLRRYFEDIMNMMPVGLGFKKNVDKNPVIEFENKKLKEMFHGGEINDKHLDWHANVDDDNISVKARISEDHVYFEERSFPDGRVYRFSSTFFKNHEDVWCELQIVQDITESKRAEEAIIESQKQLEAVLDTVGEGIMTMDANGIIIMVNTEIERIWGYRQQDLVGQDMVKLMPEKYRDGHKNGVKRYRETDESKILGKRQEFEGLKKDGTVFPLEIQIAETRIGKHHLFTAAVRDITDRKLAEAALTKSKEDLEVEVEERTRELKEKQSQLVQSEKMASLGNLVAGVAHEINTPLGALNSNNDVIMRTTEKLKEILLATDVPEELKENPKLQSLLDNLDKLNAVNKTAAERILTIVRSLRRFARLDKAELEDMDIHQGIDSTLTLVHHQIKNRIEIIKEYGDVPAIRCFPDQLNQVFMNILVNGSQAIDDKGSITIKTYVRDEQVIIQFSDTGVGIPKEILDKIFESGFTTKGTGVGTGLGLAIVAKIIKDHEGQIQIESEKGQGTTVRLILPIR